MVKITNGINVFEVTSGAYDSIYKYQGFQIVKDEDALPFADDEKPSKSADELFAAEVERKPISQWSKEEVKHYAAVRDIDLTGTKSVAEAKDVIKKVMNGEE